MAGETLMFFFFFFPSQNSCLYRKLYNVVVLVQDVKKKKNKNKKTKTKKDTTQGKFFYSFDTLNTSCG